MTPEARERPLRAWVTPLRTVLAALGLVLWVLMLAPPFSSWATRYEFAQAMQFAVFAFAVPALITTGAQWHRLGLSSGEIHVVDVDGAQVAPTALHYIDRLAIDRVRASHQRRAILVAAVFAALTVFWRVAPVVDFLVRHSWLSIVESLSLVAVGVALFSDLVESPPLVPGATRPYRIGITAAVMWTAWVVAYLDAMSHSSWYSAFHHVAGQGVSLSADQQLSAGFIWLISASVFVPIIFWNLVYWLQSEEDPDDEMQRLVREERSRGFFGTD